MFRNEPFAIFDDITSLLEDLQNAGIGRGPANAKFFQAFDKACISEAGWWLGEMLFG